MRDPRSAKVLSELLWGQRSLFSNAGTRNVAIITAVVGGAIVYELLAGTVGVLWLAFIGGTLLAIPMAVSKTATACGINVLGTFSRYDRPFAMRLGPSLVYMLTATATAALIGAIAMLLGHLWLPTTAALIIIGPFFGLLGLQELGLLPMLSTPTSRWQVPARWVKNESLAPVVWGLFLGSGIATWMPHASFYGLLLLSAVLPAPAGVGLMAVYGLVRAIPAVLAASSPRFSSEVATAHALDLRLVGHAFGGLTSLAFAGLMLASSAHALIAPDFNFVHLVQVDLASAVVITVTLAAGLFFTASGLGKLIALGTFRSTLAGTYRVPAALSGFVAGGVVVLELGAAALLLWPPTRIGGLLAASALVFVFAVAALATLVAGGDGDCGCMGALRHERLTGRTVARAFGILVALAGAAFLSFPGLPVGAYPLPEPVVLVAGGLTMAVVVGLVGAMKTLLSLQRSLDRSSGIGE